MKTRTSGNGSGAVATRIPEAPRQRRKVFGTDADLWAVYHATLVFRDKLVGGTPKDPRLIEGWLRSKAGIEDPQELRAAMASYQEYRKRNEPVQRHTGTIFQDPPGDEASRLIEQAGLKGTTRGKAHIAERNANYVVNLGGASASDIAALVVEAHQRVLEQFGVDLEVDVELHGEWLG